MKFVYHIFLLGCFSYLEYFHLTEKIHIRTCELGQTDFQTFIAVKVSSLL